MSTISEQIIMVRRPVGEPVADDFELREVELPELQDGQVLVKNLWLSLDPYMRFAMNDTESYMDPLKVGEVIVGGTVSVVMASRSERYQVGDTICCYGGWCSHAVLNVGPDNGSMYKVDPSQVPLSTYLGAAGMPGRTAYFGLLRLGRPQPGETLVVAAAAGAVGSAVGQIAKMQGCRVIGVAGTPEKCAYVVDELGFDLCLSHRAGDLEEQLTAACPDGVDIYFENVGGRVLNAVAPLLNSGARAPICGFIAQYNDTDINQGTPMDVLGALPEPPEHRFFLVGEWAKEYEPATQQLADWIKEGRLKYQETIAEGLANAPQAFIGMLNGANVGKQLVRISE